MWILCQKPTRKLYKKIVYQFNYYFKFNLFIYFSPQYLHPHLNPPPSRGRKRDEIILLQGGGKKKRAKTYHKGKFLFPSPLGGRGPG
jgi:hypothetical protein